MPNVFLTGASAGIGLTTAKRLTGEGFQVWGTSRDISRLPNLKNFHPLQLNLNDSQSIETAFRRALAEAGALDILINNAGCGYFAPLEHLSPEIWQEQLQTLLLGPLQLIRLALPVMKQKKGLIINVASLAARFPLPFMSPYNASKAALHSLTQTLRLELGPRSPVQVVELQPGDIRTPFHDSMRCQSQTEDYASAMKNAHAVMTRNIQAAPPPEKVAEIILRIIRAPSPKPLYKAGDFFQTALAPLGSRLFPAALLERALRLFYRLDEK
ncbi:MAG: SDR family oxidoreductase [bacterium]